MRKRLFNAFRGPGGIGELLAIAFPLVVSHACETVMLFTDRLFLSRLGPQYMSAAMGGGLAALLLMTFFLGVTGYANALVAQHLGAGRKENCPLAATQALLVSVAAYPLIVGCIPAGHWLFGLLDVPLEQRAPQQAYFNILVLGSVMGLLRNSLVSYFSGIGRTRVVMLSAAGSMVVNVVANWVLIFGRLGLPALGIRGAAIGTLLGSACGLGILVAVYLSRAHRTTWEVIAGTRFNRPMMGRLLRFGYPAGIEFFLNMLAFNVVVLTFHSYGLAVAAAVTIAFNWDLVSFVPMLGVNVGVTSLVGRYMGAARPDLAHRATVSALFLVALYSGVLMLFFGLSPGALVAVFQPAGMTSVYTEAAPLAIFMVRLVAVYIMADAVGLVFSGALRGAGDTFMTMCLSVGSHWMLALATLFMVNVVAVSPRTSWLLLVMLVWSIGLGFYLRYRSGRWRAIRVVAPGSTAPPIDGNAGASM